MSRHFALPVSHGSQAATLDVYEAMPSGPPRGGVIIVQEIFGVTDHIRSVADRYAAMGFIAWAPAFFDVVEKNVVLDPEKPEAMKQGLQIAGQLGWDWPLEAVRACSREFAARNKSLPLALIGFCWGGSVAWLTATRAPEGFTATVGYYGSKAPETKDEKPKIPVMMHFGSKDPSIPLQKVEELKQAQPQVPVEVYNASHAFNRDNSKTYVREAAELAQEKTIAFLVRHGF